MQGGHCSLSWDLHSCGSDVKGEEQGDVWAPINAVSPDVLLSL